MAAISTQQIPRPTYPIPAAPGASNAGSSLLPPPYRPTQIYTNFELQIKSIASKATQYQCKTLDWCYSCWPGGKIPCFVMMVGFLRPATTSGWKTVITGYCNFEIQDGVQDGRHILKSSYYHCLLFHVQYNTYVHRFYGFRGQGIYLWWFQSDWM